MTNLLRWQKSIPVSVNPLSTPFARMQSALDRAMDDFYTSFDLPSTKKMFENLAITPAVDIVDDKDHFKVEVEMPGMGEEDVHVTINENILTIKGEKETAKQNKDKNYVMREIHYGSYERQVKLPETVDINRAKATFKKGMLWIDIPKRPEISKESVSLKIEKA